MSKVEDLASKEWKDLGFVNNEQSNAFKLGYLKGYHQAEKDLELSWEDIKLLDEIFMNEKINSGLILGKKGCEEVLKHFKERKYE